MNIPFPVTITVSNHPTFRTIQFSIEEVKLQPTDPIPNSVAAFITIEGNPKKMLFSALVPATSFFDMEDQLFEAIHKVVWHIYTIGVDFIPNRNWISMKYLIRDYSHNILFSVVEAGKNKFSIDGSKTYFS
jgi:hypothetical protein